MENGVGRTANAVLKPSQFLRALPSAVALAQGGADPSSAHFVGTRALRAPLGMTEREALRAALGRAPRTPHPRTRAPAHPRPRAPAPYWSALMTSTSAEPSRA